MARRRKVGKGELRRFVIAPPTIGRSIGMTLSHVLRPHGQTRWIRQDIRTPALIGGVRRAAMQRPREGSKLALDGLGPANELVVELIISNTEGH